MNTIELEGLRFHFYLNWHSPSDSSSICFIPRDESLKNILLQQIPADKIIYDLFTFMDDFFYDHRQLFDFKPMFKETVELFELSIEKKEISTKELSGLIHEHLLAAWALYFSLNFHHLQKEITLSFRLTPLSYAFTLLFTNECMGKLSPFWY